jgi:ATP-dependent Clp protease ATP-binding subunit ClpA
LEDLNRLQSGGVKEFLWSAPKSSRVEVVGARRDQSDVAESSQFANVERASDLLHRSIIGQKASIETVVSGLEAVAAGTRTDTDRPLSFMMIGPTGVGKTETAKLTAQGLRRNFYVVPMENHKDEHGLWQLLGSPQGYYGGEGMLTREVAGHPRTVLLFDELEKGAVQMTDVFLRMLDEGKVRDKRTDRDIDFSQCVIYFTSNLIVDIPRNIDQNGLRTLVQKTGALRPELVARIGVIVPFYAFTDADMHTITELQLTSYLDSVCKNRRITPKIQVHRDAIELLASRQDPKFGARNVSSTIEQYIEPRLRKALLARGRTAIGTVSVGTNQEEILVTVD